MKNEGVLYHGLEILGGGSILSGLILASIAVFVIDRYFYKAAAFAAVGAVMTFFGFMHGERIGIRAVPDDGRELPASGGRHLRLCQALQSGAQALPHARAWCPLIFRCVDSVE